MDTTKGAVGFAAAAVLAGCSTSEPEIARLEGVLGYAEFILRCSDSQDCGANEFPSFAVGATFDFDVEVRSDFPFHEAGAHVDIHRGDTQSVEGSELQTVMAISNHSDGYLIDYAFVHLYEANGFELVESAPNSLPRDDQGFTIPLGGDVSGRPVAYHDGNRLEGTVVYSFRALDPEVVDLASAGNETVRLIGRKPGEGRLEVSGIGHTQTFTFRVEHGTRTNPPTPDEPEPTRTNPLPDPTTDTDTDTDADTGTGTDGGSGGTAGSTGTTGGMR
jgi:hypothetical protein